MFLGTVSAEKTAILLDIVQITSPPSPQFGQLVQLFSDVKIQDLKVIRTKNTIIH